MSKITLSWTCETGYDYFEIYASSTITTSTMNLATMDTILLGYGEQAIGFKLPMSRVAIYKGALTDADILKIASISPIQYE